MRRFATARKALDATRDGERNRHGIAVVAMGARSTGRPLMDLIGYGRHEASAFLCHDVRHPAPFQVSTFPTIRMQEAAFFWDVT